MRKMKEYTYILPPVNGVGEAVTKTTNQNSIVIIGANGSGKSRLGIWIENQNRVGVHRIGAQRSLKWAENLTPKSFELLSNTFLYGSETVNSKNLNYYHAGGKDGKSYTERRDIDAVFSAIFSKRTAQLEDFDERSKTAPNQTLPRENNIVDDIQQVWNDVFPHRGIAFTDMSVLANVGNFKYNGVEMSDGKRVALYLIAQVLLMPDKKTIIIDEPEIHLHRSIMNHLWAAIEQARPDCLFIYITHDTEFAAAHMLSNKIWCKGYDGKHFEWHIIDETELPDELLLDILGNRKQVIFVEGTKDSYDTKLYENLYKDYYIVPCGSCSEVIARTKVMNNTMQLNHLKAYGIIDRDYRCDMEICRFTRSNIYVLGVAEVENLFITKEIFEIVNRHFMQTDDRYSYQKCSQFRN